MPGASTADRHEPADRVIARRARRIALLKPIPRQPDLTPLLGHASAGQCPLFPLSSHDLRLPFSGCWGISGEDCQLRFKRALESRARFAAGDIGDKVGIVLQESQRGRAA